MLGPELPEALRRGPFSVSELRTKGLPASRLRHEHLVRPTRSVRSTSEPAGTVERAAAFAVALPADCAFSHVTAAVLLGLPLPPALEGQLDLDVMRETSRPRIRRSGCLGHRGLEGREVLRVRGVRAVAPADTWVDLGEVLHRGLGVEDLVVVGDVVANRYADGPAALFEALDRRTRARGAEELRRAGRLVRAGVRSPQESRARLMLVRAGFPEPEVNADVHDAAGGWLLEGDLVWRRQRVIGEYQGEDHASRRQGSSDAHRAGLAHAAGWTVVELFAEDLSRPPRRRVTLLRLARELMIDPTSLRID